MPEKNEIGIVGHLSNVTWSIIGFTPVLLYWMDAGVQKWLFIFVLLAVILAVLPKDVFYKLRLSGRRKFYEIGGVKTFRKLVQEGNHSWTTKTEKKYIANKMEAKRYLGKIDMYERFHWCCLVFFLCTSIHCFFSDKAMYGALILMANIIYNIPTILLQQYNRLRIETLLEHRENQG